LLRFQLLLSDIDVKIDVFSLKLKMLFLD